MNKIYIIGPVGSGKTTLALNLSKKYHIPAYELDKVVWNDNQHLKRKESEIKEIWQDILKKETWIIEDVGREIFREGISQADITYYIDLPKFIIYKRCLLRWIKQKLGKEKYNYQPTLKGLLQMLQWAKKDLKNKKLKLQYIKENAKEYKILYHKDMNQLLTERNSLMKKTIYLIRHSIKENMYGEIDSDDTLQVQDEKRILSIKGENLAYKLSKLKELQNIEELWCSTYVRAIQTAKYISNNKIKMNISSDFDERHYGEKSKNFDKETFLINQFKDKNLKNKNGESQEEVRNRFENKINELLDNSKSSRIAVVAHNVCILFYLLKYCKLIDAQVPKKLTISYNNKILIKDSIMETPSIIKLEFEGRKLLNIEYIEIE